MPATKRSAPCEPSSQAKRPRITTDEQPPNYRYNLRKRSPVSYSDTSKRRQKKPTALAASRDDAPRVQTPPTSPCAPCRQSFSPSSCIPTPGSPSHAAPVRQPSPSHEPASPSHITAHPAQHPTPTCEPTPPPYDGPPAEPSTLTDLELLDEPHPYPPIPWLPDFSCTFVREIQTTETAAVLVVALADGSQRILKLFAHKEPEENDPFATEFHAYCALRHHGVCAPPTAARSRRVVPFCYGPLQLRSWRQIKRVGGWKSAWRKTQPVPAVGLLLEYIPNATTISAAPGRLSQRPELVDDALAALAQVHAAGVLHDDALPRNILVDDAGHVWWLDFGASCSTAFTRIDPFWFEAERWRVLKLLRDDVIPAYREGRLPQWRIMGL
ncbi:hypothetical protein FN846DRAFT_916650 [Sphaerosporella brunnea]|uniref:Protein kinase domain-containing protein n=1 Tax=Sphaerosporella brunnea TaxID=1250544 RepID=A0A5J5F6K2_9PEZI|nr:hypothetical protein FN846DRAFT_916650 [Sphaerosporella brunnea]